MKPALEARNPAVSLQDVAEEDLVGARSRKLRLTDREPGGIKAGDMLFNAEQNLLQAVARYLRRGANAKLVRKAVNYAIKYVKEKG